MLVLLAVLPGCMGRSFKEAGTPPPAVPSDLGALRWQEYWTGIIFNGDKVGFSRLAVHPAPDQPGRYVIESEASLLFQLMGFQKTVQMRSRDVVAADLTLIEFHHWHNLDGNALEVKGSQQAGALSMTVVTRGHSSETTLHPPAPVYPASALTLLPVIRGLEVGRKYRYQIYSGETQSLLDVLQKVVAYEESELYPGRAFKVQTAASGHRATTWIDAQGRPQFELAFNGVVVSVLETATEVIPGGISGEPAAAPADQRQNRLPRHP
jgi:hypothetical protein